MRPRRDDRCRSRHAEPWRTPQGVQGAGETLMLCRPQAEKEARSTAKGEALAEMEE
jgi:hypothetical protein